MHSLHIIHYDSVLVFVYMSLWKKGFAACSLCMIVLIGDFTHVTLLNPQSINELVP